MLTALNAAQLVLYIALLAMLGQGALHLLAGRGRDRNVFYQLLGLLSRPFTALVRRVSPARLPPRAVPLVTFTLLAAAYLAVTLEKISLCLRLEMVGCR